MMMSVAGSLRLRLAQHPVRVADAGHTEASACRRAGDDRRHASTSRHEPVQTCEHHTCISRQRWNRPDPTRPDPTRTLLTQ